MCILWVAEVFCNAVKSIHSDSLTLQVFLLNYLILFEPVFDGESIMIFLFFLYLLKNCNLWTKLKDDEHMCYLHEQVDCPH